MTVTQSKQERLKNIHDTFTMLMRISKRWFVQRLQSFNLTLPQFITLAALVAHKETCTMSDLTNVTFQDPPTTTGIIDRLVKTNLVKRSRSQTDRRVVLVQATQAGIDLINQIEETLMQEALPGYATLTDEELDTFQHLLSRILRVHLKQVMQINDEQVEVEIEKLQHFVKDPIYYAKLENTKTT